MPAFRMYFRYCCLFCQLWKYFRKWIFQGFLLQSASHEHRSPVSLLFHNRSLSRRRSSQSGLLLPLSFWSSTDLFWSAVLCCPRWFQVFRRFLQLLLFLLHYRRMLRNRVRIRWMRSGEAGRTDHNSVFLLLRWSSWSHRSENGAALPEQCIKLLCVLLSLTILLHKGQALCCTCIR